MHVNMRKSEMREEKLNHHKQQQQQRRQIVVAKWTYWGWKEARQMLGISVLREMNLPVARGCFSLLFIFSKVSFLSLTLLASSSSSTTCTFASNPVSFPLRFSFLISRLRLLVLQPDRLVSYESMLLPLYNCRRLYRLYNTFRQVGTHYNVCCFL